MFFVGLVRRVDIRFDQHGHSGATCIEVAVVTSGKPAVANVADKEFLFNEAAIIMSRKPTVAVPDVEFVYHEVAVILSGTPAVANVADREFLYREVSVNLREKPAVT